MVEMELMALDVLSNKDKEQRRALLYLWEACRQLMTMQHGNDVARRSPCNQPHEKREQG